MTNSVENDFISNKCFLRKKVDAKKDQSTNAAISSPYSKAEGEHRTDEQNEILQKVEQEYRDNLTNIATFCENTFEKICDECGADDYTRGQLKKLQQMIHSNANMPDVITNMAKDEEIDENTSTELRNSIWKSPGFYFVLLLTIAALLVFTIFGKAYIPSPSLMW